MTPYVLGSVGPGTLAEELAKRGYAYRDVGLNSGRHEILRDGRRVTVKDADGCWSWLARLDRKLRNLPINMAACRPE